MTRTDWNVRDYNYRSLYTAPQEWNPAEIRQNISSAVTCGHSHHVRCHLEACGVVYSGQDEPDDRGHNQSACHTPQQQKDQRNESEIDGRRFPGPGLPAAVGR